MYYVYMPTFSISSVGRLVARFAILNSSSVSSASEPVFMSQSPSGLPGYGPMYPISADYFGGSGTNCFLQVGCAITANNAGQSVIPTQGAVVAVGSPLPMKDVPANAVVPVISQTELVVDFAIPQAASTFFAAFKVSGGTQNLFTSATTWYGHTQAAAASSFDFPWPHLPTWFSPTTTFSASPTFAKNGGTSTLTITVPDSLRTLTASDLVVTGGTISNFTKVS